MPDELFRNLRKPPSSGSPYSFQGGNPVGSSFRRQTTTVNVTPPTSQNHTTTQQPRRTEDFDREPAYEPPAAREEGVIYEYRPPSFGEIIIDLGLRILEVAVAAAAKAAGDEIAYFFRVRRLMPRRIDREDDR